MGKTANILSEEKQRALMESLSENLAPLRVKAEISQADLAKLLGVSYRTYIEIENKKKTMPWSVYLSLLLFFDYNTNTHKLLRDLGVYPEDLIELINRKNKNNDSNFARLIFPGVPECVIERLDDQAFRVIRNVVMIEYARCEKLTSEDIMRFCDCLLNKAGDK